GVVVGKSPLEDAVFVEPGHHTVEARLGPRFATSPTDVVAGARQNLSLTLKEPGTPPITPRRDGPSVPLIATGAAVTGVAIVVGTVLAVVAHGKASDASTKRDMLPPANTVPCQAFGSTCDAINSDLRARDALSKASMGMFIG